MRSRTEADLKKRAYSLAAQYRQVTGSLYIQSAPTLLRERVVTLPPLSAPDGVHQSLIADAYGTYPIGATEAAAVWEYLALMVKDRGWSPGKPFFEFVAEYFPDLKLTPHTPRGKEYDTRGLLCQTLQLLKHRLLGTRLFVTSGDVWLKAGTKTLAGISTHAITWSRGHYICRSANTKPIDFHQWVTRPLPSSRTLSPTAAVLRLRLMHVLPHKAHDIDVIFRCVGVLGLEAESVVCEPFDVVLTDDAYDPAAATTAVLEIQQALKAKR